MARLLFEKTGRAVWISHLDLMRLFQRAFQRAGLSLKHTQGFNPRPSVSIALPLSVGIYSQCELLDFELDGQVPSLEEIRDRLNRSLVEGVRILEVYENGRKLKDLSLLSCQIRLEYDNGSAAEAGNEIDALFSKPSLFVEKRSKNGPTEQDIIPLIKKLKVSVTEAQEVTLHALICCQNPALNPMQLAAAIERYIPQFKPDHVVVRRLDIFDANQEQFR